MSVELTEKAARRVKNILSDETPGAVLRVGVEGGGCSGFQYTYVVAPAADADDYVIEREGARVVIDPTSLAYLLGARIDFVDDLMGQAFKIENPNAVASCGCGTSFSI